MVIENGSVIRHRDLTLFFTAANSLLISGIILNEKWDWVGSSVILWCALCGIFLIYRINDYIDQGSGYQFRLREFFSSKWHLLFIIQLLLATTPLAFFTLSLFRFVVFVFITLLAILYSVSFRVGEKRYRLKNVFLFKNISIGVAWGALVPVGADEIMSPDVLSLFVFASVQVMIGSMIRDIPDREKDRAHGVRTFPVVIGVENTVFSMQILNGVTVSAAAISQWSVNILIIILPTVLWRSVNLLGLKRNADSPRWVQVVNLLTCSVILFFVIVQFLKNDLGKH